MKKRHNESKPERTKAEDKMLYYLRALIEDPAFLAEVRAIRLRYGLPEEGLKQNVADQFEFITSLSVYTDDRGNESTFQKDLYDLACRADLSSPWLQAVENYILWDDLFFKDALGYVQLFDVAAILEEQEEYDGGTVDEEIRPDFMRNITDAFPLAIFISPHASQRDIIDFVKKRYAGEIKSLQKKHGGGTTKIGKIRKGKEGLRERNAFIRENSHLPGRELGRLVRERFGQVLDYTYLNKIKISKKKRK